MVPQARYPGELCAHTTSGTSARRDRLQKAELAWCSMGSFRTRQGCSGRSVCMVFRAVVLETAICGLVLFILSKSDFVALDRFATSKGRYLMRGQACVKTVQADGIIKYAAISNDDVLGYLAFADSFTELRIRRLQFWQRSVACPEKVHAVVARSTFRSQNVQDTPFSDHFWKLRMSKKCTPLWREAHFKVKMLKNTTVRTTFGRSDVVPRGRRNGLWTLSKVSKT